MRIKQDRANNIREGRYKLFGGNRLWFWGDQPPKALRHDTEEILGDPEKKLLYIDLAGLVEIRKAPCKSNEPAYRVETEWHFLLFSNGEPSLLRLKTRTNASM